MSPAHAASPAELQERIAAERAGATFVVFRDGEGRQRIQPLEEPDLTVGRGAGADIRLAWDEKVSRIHAELDLVGDDWTVSDDGLSRNGTFLNGERVTGRRRLCDGDVLRFGNTTVTFRRPEPADGGETALDSSNHAAPTLSDAQRRVLVALCRPYKDSGSYATPASNPEIADELVLSVDAVKTHMRALFTRLGIDDLPQNRKRAALVEKALQHGLVSPREL